jgi:hypothetical protein
MAGGLHQFLALDVWLTFSRGFPSAKHYVE